MLSPAGGSRPDLFTNDGLHMNSAGYDLWTTQIRAWLDALPRSEPGYLNLHSNCEHEPLPVLSARACDIRLFGREVQVQVKVSFGGLRMVSLSNP